MVTVAQIERGLAAYIDKNVVPNIPDDGKFGGLMKAGIGMMAAIAIRRLDQRVAIWREMPAVKFLEIFDEHGNVDIDVLKDEFVKQIPVDGIKIELPGGMDVTFKESDVQDLYNTIVSYR